MSRENIKYLQEIPNIGKAIAKELNLIGIHLPGQLIGNDPYKMYSKLCNATNQQQDKCVLDVFISAVRYMEGGPAKKWWEFTKERKNKLGQD